MNQLEQYAHSEAMDAAEDIAEGERFTPRLRILEAASYYSDIVDRHERIDHIIEVIEEAFRKRGLPIS